MHIQCRCCCKEIEGVEGGHQQDSDFADEQLATARSRSLSDGLSIRMQAMEVCHLSLCSVLCAFYVSSGCSDWPVPRWHPHMPSVFVFALPFFPRFLYCFFCFCALLFVFACFFLLLFLLRSYVLIVFASLLALRSSPFVFWGAFCAFFLVSRSPP